VDLLQKLLGVFFLRSIHLNRLALASRLLALLSATFICVVINFHVRLLFFDALDFVTLFLFVTICLGRRLLVALTHALCLAALAHLALAQALGVVFVGSLLNDIEVHATQASSGFELVFCILFAVNII